MVVRWWINDASHLPLTSWRAIPRVREDAGGGSVGVGVGGGGGGSGSGEALEASAVLRGYKGHCSE